MAGKNSTGGIDEHQPLAPSSHAGLGKARIVIGHHEVDADASGETFFRCGDGFGSFFELACGWAVDAARFRNAQP